MPYRVAGIDVHVGTHRYQLTSTGRKIIAAILSALSSTVAPTHTSDSQTNRGRRIDALKNLCKRKQFWSLSTIKNERYREWLLKNSLTRNPPKKDCVRMPYKRLSLLGWTFSIPKIPPDF
jgi:hypothetical protein